jgi:hypothetical protein
MGAEKELNFFSWKVGFFRAEKLAFTHGFGRGGRPPPGPPGGRGASEAAAGGGEWNDTEV